MDRFDEVHFGGFAGQYINGTYYFDVHPPLAKILIALSGQVFGYKGDFDFGTIGK
jgi:dolichyl-phosphate-mannose-protein mannosyltransferase